LEYKVKRFGWLKLKGKIDNNMTDLKEVLSHGEDG